MEQKKFAEKYARLKALAATADAARQDEIFPYRASETTIKARNRTIRATAIDLQTEFENLLAGNELSIEQVNALGNITIFTPGPEYESNEAVKISVMSPRSGIYSDPVWDNHEARMIQSLAGEAGYKAQCFSSRGYIRIMLERPKTTDKARG